MATTTHAGKSALHFSAARGFEAVSRTLIRAGGDLSAKDSDGMTPLHCGASIGAAAEAMLDAGAGACTEIGNLLPNNRRQRRTCYALCHIMYPVSAAHMSIFRMDSNSTSYGCVYTWDARMQRARNLLSCGLVTCCLSRRACNPLSLKGLVTCCLALSL